MTEPLVHPATTAHRAHATVTTEAAARYAKQLASHLGRKAEIRHEVEGSPGRPDRGQLLARRR